MPLIRVLGVLDKDHTQSHCISVNSSSVSSSPIILNRPRSPSILVFRPKFYMRSQIAKTDYQLHVRLPNRLPGTTRLPLDGFPWNLIRVFFENFVEKIQVSLKSDKNNGHFTWKPIHIFFLIISFSVLIRMRNISDEGCRANQNTHFVLNNVPPPTEYRALYEIAWKNMVEPDRPQMTK